MHSSPRWATRSISRKRPARYYGTLPKTSLTLNWPRRSTCFPLGVELTALGFLAGDRSLVVGGADGSVTIHFLVPNSKNQTSADGFTLTRTRVLRPQTAAIKGLSSSLRSKTFATYDASGNIWLRHGTSEKTILQLSSEAEKEAERTIVLAPRLDGLLAMWKDGRAVFWDIYVPHPETSWRTLFGKVWYEGYAEPSYTWQSTGATDAFEPKLSLVPLIFGTMKATFYSLLFAVPIALLARGLHLRIPAPSSEWQN